MTLDRFISSFPASTDIEYSRLLLQMRKTACESQYHNPTRYERAISASSTGRDPMHDSRVLPLYSRRRKVTIQSIIRSQKRTKWRLQKPMGLQKMNGIVDDVYNHSFDLLEGRYALCGRWGYISIIDLTTKEHTMLAIGEKESENVSAAHWIDGNTAATGTTFSALDIIDVNNENYICNYNFERSTVRVIDHASSNEIYAGLLDGSVSRIDLRCPEKDKVVQLDTQTITSLAINRLVAVGNNQDQLVIFDPRKFNDPLAELTGHKAAVTSLEWLDDNHLISGAGSRDQCLRVWCMYEPGKPFMVSDTKSQVTGIHILDQRTFVTTHGYGASKREGVRLWSIRDRRMVNLTSYWSPHKNRIIYSAMSHSILITGSGENADLGCESEMCVWNFTKTSLQRADSKSRFQLPAIR